MSSQVADRPRIGTLLRDWRVRRRMSQQDLALEAGVSARHVSFVETGRSKPSADMVIQLAEHLEVPLRDRNTLLLAAGFAPAYAQRDLDEPEMGPVREAIDRVLRGHEPYPAVVVDRHWGLVAANRAVPLLIGGAADHLLEPPVNVLRLSLHPEGMAPRIENLGEWRAHLLHDLAALRDQTGDEALHALYEELTSYPGPQAEPGATHDVFVPLKIDGLTFLSTRTTFGTALDVTVAELAIEAFYPADEATFTACSARR